MQTSMGKTVVCFVNHTMMIHWATSYVAVLERECVWRGIRIQTATAPNVHQLKDAVREHVRCLYPQNGAATNTLYSMTMC